MVGVSASAGGVAGRGCRAGGAIRSGEQGRCRLLLHELVPANSFAYDPAVRHGCTSHRSSVCGRQRNLPQSCSSSEADSLLMRIAPISRHDQEERQRETRDEESHDEVRDGIWRPNPHARHLAPGLGAPQRIVSLTDLLPSALPALDASLAKPSVINPREGLRVAGRAPWRLR